MSYRRLALAVALFALCAIPAHAVDTLVSGKIGMVKTGKLVKWISKSVAPGTFTLPAAPNSPLVVPWNIWIFINPYAAHYGLSPSTHWKGLGNPVGSKGYKYKGAGTPSDPCKVVLLKPKIIKAICKGPGIAPLDPPYVDPVQFTLGAADQSDQYCAEFGGTIVRNQPGLFKAKDAPPPTACGPTSPSGAFLEVDGLF